jgi:hypothetical protein
MWALPNIKRLNDEAAGVDFKARHRKQLCGRAKVECYICDKPATKGSRQEWFDIFSDEPKGVIGLCKAHEEDYGGTPEGYFFCEDCQRLFIQNYTWEMYCTQNEQGDIVCLNCKAKEYVEDGENWIPLDDAVIDDLTFKQVSKTPHLIAVSGPTPDGIEFYKNVELDSFSGGRITGYSSSESGPEGGVSELQDILRGAREDGHTEAILILDAAYQFCVSIGVYVRG